MGLCKTITKSDVISIPENYKMLAPLWRFHNLFKFVKISNGTTCVWLYSIIHCCCLCLIKHQIPFYNKLDITKWKQHESCKT
jgi:hypothetical protein